MAEEEKRQISSEIKITKIRIKKPDGGFLDVIPAPVEEGVMSEIFMNLILMEMKRCIYHLILQNQLRMQVII